MNSRFTDPTGQEWSLALNYGLALAVQRDTGVNLTVTTRDAKWVECLFDDPGRLVSVLWILCEEQANRLDVSAEQFPYRFDGPTLEAAGNALAFAIAGFFQRSKIGSAIAKGLPLILAEADRKAAERIGQAVTMACSTADNSPESVGSIPPG